MNNHLTVINACTELLALDGCAGNSQNLAEIRKAAHEIGSLAGQLLAFSREQLDQHPVPLDLNRLIGDSRDLLQLLAGRQVRLETRLAPDLRPVEAVPGQIAQVLVGLTTLAHCAMPGGRTLTFETANTREGVALSVTDTGLDLHEKTRARLFEPFASTTQGWGMGSGLAVAHGIVARHGGHVEVTGCPGQGTTLTIYLPAQKGASCGAADLSG
jgi:signal transduction histidine kinase